MERQNRFNPDHQPKENTMKRLLLIILLATAWSGLSPKASAWGVHGHDAIAYIAELNLNPGTKAIVERYLDDGLGPGVEVPRPSSNAISTANPSSIIRSGSTRPASSTNTPSSIRRLTTEPISPPTTSPKPATAASTTASGRSTKTSSGSKTASTKSFRTRS